MTKTYVILSFMEKDDFLVLLNNLLIQYGKNPKDFEVCLAIAKIYSNLKMQKDAILYYQSALKLNPQKIEINIGIGVCYFELGEFDNAILAYEKILNCNDESEFVLQFKSSACLNISNIYYYLNCFDKAIEYLEQSININPENADAYVNIGNCYNAKKDIQNAIKYYKKALNFSENDADTLYNLASAQLSLGDFENGFANYEYRMFRPRTSATQYFEFKKTRWKGENLAGKTIYVYHEQGMGDAIQFVRFFYELKKMGASVIYNAPEILKELFLSSELISPKIVPLNWHLETENFENEFDYYCPLMSLPYVLKTSQETIPLSKGYIVPSSKKVQKFKEFFKDDSNKLKIGINWKGNPLGNLAKSLELKDFYPLCLPEVSLYSFQKGVWQEEIAQKPSSIKIIDISQYLKDFSDSAAALANMDLLITNDSSLAHLGGAMGVKTFVLLNYIPDWRWGTTSSNSFWYDSIKLYRQTKLGNWDDVIQTVKSEIQHLIA